VKGSGWFAQSFYRQKRVQVSVEPKISRKSASSEVSRLSRSAGASVFALVESTSCIRLGHARYRGATFTSVHSRLYGTGRPSRYLAPTYELSVANVDDVKVLPQDPDLSQAQNAFSHTTAEETQKEGDHKVTPKERRRSVHALHGPDTTLTHNVKISLVQASGDKAKCAGRLSRQRG
jgi:hypothetical protein